MNTGTVLSPSTLSNGNESTGIKGVGVIARLIRIGWELRMNLSVHVQRINAFQRLEDLYLTRSTSLRLLPKRRKDWVHLVLTENSSHYKQVH